MRKVTYVEITLDELVKEVQRTNWVRLPAGEIFLDKSDKGWKAYEVLGSFEGEYRLSEPMDIKIV